MSRLEGEVSPIIADAITKNALPERMSDGHLALLTFVLFQHARTPSRAAAMNEHTEKLVKTLAKDFPDLKDEANGIQVNDRDAPVTALRAVGEIRHFAADLKLKLLENKTRRLFITSDNPAVLYNQFLEKRNPQGGNTGIQCIGLQIFLPLGPRHLLMLYDGNVYRVGGRQHLQTHIEITREADVEALNVLQAANADNVLYYSADTDVAHVREAVGRATAYRWTERVRITEHPGVGPDGRAGTLFACSRVDMQIGLALDFAVVLPSAVGPPLKVQAAYLRDPELVYRFEAARKLRQCDPRRLVEAFLRR